MRPTNSRGAEFPAAINPVSSRDDWGWQECHDALSSFLREIHETRILASTSPAIAAAWGERIHGRSLKASGVRTVGKFSPETRAVIERYRAEGRLR